MTPDLMESVSTDLLTPTRRNTRDTPRAVPATRGLSLKAQRRLMLVFLAATDAAVLLCAFRLAFWVRFHLQITLAPEVVPQHEYYQGLSVSLVPVWMCLLACFGLYNPGTRLGGLVETSRTFQASTVATMMVIVGTFLLPDFVISRVWLVAVWGLTFLFVATNRLLATQVVYACRRRGYLLVPAVIVGTNQEAHSLASHLSDTVTSGVRTLGFVMTGRSDLPPGRSQLPVLGTTEAISAVVRDHGVEDLIVAITALSREELLALCEDVDTLPVQLRLSSGLYELLTTRVTVRTLGHVPVMTVQKSRLGPAESAMKTLLECTIAVLALLALSLPLLAIAIWIKLESAGPVIYRRRVLGASGTQFDAFKFRTMYTNGDELLARHDGAVQQLRTVHKLKADPRVTRSGRWLRKFSLDELPQLFNVLLGQMALVGPRMISPQEADNYGRHRLTLFAVKPGITGLWQVSGRSDLSYEERIRFDLYYVRNYSLWLDLQILFQTIPAVLLGRGAY